MRITEVDRKAILIAFVLIIPTFLVPWALFGSHLFSEWWSSWLRFAFAMAIWTYLWSYPTTIHTLSEGKIDDHVIALNAICTVLGFFVLMPPLAATDGEFSEALSWIVLIIHMTGLHFIQKKFHALWVELYARHSGTPK